jgi:hypothetical protein
LHDSVLLHVVKAADPLSNQVQTFNTSLDLGSLNADRTGVGKRTYICCAPLLPSALVTYEIIDYSAS